MLVGLRNFTLLRNWLRFAPSPLALPRPPGPSLPTTKEELIELDTAFDDVVRHLAQAEVPVPLAPADVDDPVDDPAQAFRIANELQSLDDVCTALQFDQRSQCSRVWRFSDSKSSLIDVLTVESVSNGFTASLKVMIFP